MMRQDRVTEGARKVPASQETDLLRQELQAYRDRVPPAVPGEEEDGRRD